MSREPISKSLRYEVLRRDGHRCRYCGATADETRLTVDHVVPVALGGRSTPENLVAACRDCNAGKSSTPPSADTVAEAADDAKAWSAAMRKAKRDQQAARKRMERDAEAFEQRWLGWFEADTHAPVWRPHDWKHSIGRMTESGLSMDDLLYALDVSMSNDRIAPSATWKYFCGVAWTILRKRQEAAAQIASGSA